MLSYPLMQAAEHLGADSSMAWSYERYTRVRIDPSRNFRVATDPRAEHGKCGMTPQTALRTDYVRDTVGQAEGIALHYSRCPEPSPV